MPQRLFQIAVLSILTCALVLGGGATGPDAVHSDGLASLLARLGAGPSEASAQPELVSTIVFTSTRSDPGCGLRCTAASVGYVAGTALMYSTCVQVPEMEPGTCNRPRNWGSRCPVPSSRRAGCWCGG